MAKASRSKKQPAFDPGELDDLIFSPVVGRGVGSHLIVSHPDVTTVAESSTVDVLTTVDNMTAVDIIARETPAVPADFTLSTVDRSSIAEPSAGPIDNVTTVANPYLSTENTPHTPVPAPGWITEGGGLIGSGRVRQISNARDVINPGEQAVYDALWNAGTPDTEHPDSRVVQAGYDYLGKQSGLAKKTIQRVIDKLLEKDFIIIERPADIYQRTATVYRVFGPGTVLKRHARKGRTHFAKIGPGFSYVQRLERV
jgi:hypothetical protein